MKTSLTPQEEQLMHSVREEWMGRIFDPVKRLKLDKVKAEKQVKWLYALAGLKEPEVIFVESPMGLQYAANLILAMIQDRAFRNSVGNGVWNGVRNSVENGVWNSVENGVRNSVWNSVGKMQYFQFCWHGSVRDWGWCSFFDFFTRINIVSEEKFDQFLDLLNSGIYDMIQMEAVCLGCPMPTKLKQTDMREEMRLHEENGFAIEWPDGYGQHHLYGVFFPPELYKKVTGKRVTAKIILNIKDIDQRMAALKHYGMERLLESSKAELIARSDRGNMLYMIPKGVFNVDAYFLSYVCPSTGRKYVSGVDPEVGKRGDPDEAMAWKFSLQPEQYSSLVAES